MTPSVLGQADDATLVAAARSGDDEALDLLLRRHYPRVHALCRRLTGDDHDALDAAQEALLAVTRGLARFDGRAAFTTWLYRVTTNACLDELRRRRRRPAVLDDEHLEHRGAGRTDDVPGLAEAVTDRIAIDEALAGLPAEFRAAVVLRDLCG